MLMYPKIDPIALQIGPVAIHWYGLTYLAAFALFFPDPSGAPALQTRRLGIAEVQRAAGLLREKIKADEVRPPPRLSSSRRSR